MHTCLQRCQWCNSRVAGSESVTAKVFICGKSRQNLQKIWSKSQKRKNGAQRLQKNKLRPFLRSHTKTWSS